MKQNVCALVKGFIIACILVFASDAMAAQLVEVVTASNKVIAVVIETVPHTDDDYSNPLNMDLSAWKVNDRPPVKIYRRSAPWDQLKKNAPGYKGYPVIMRHYIYLELKNPLINNKTYSLITPYGKQSFRFNDRETMCESIKVNQVGYNEHSDVRYAVLGVFLGDGGSIKFSQLPDYDVVDENTGVTIFTGAAVYFGDDTGINGVSSGEHVYHLDLSSLPAGGPYFVSVRGVGRSYSFGVGDDYSREIAYVHTRGLYHQRCGIALEKPYTEYTRGICHTEVAHTKTPWGASSWIKVPEGAQMYKIRGGYHDAGDFDRRPMHTIIPILMLGYYEAFPDHFVDNQYNLPESGNLIPDFLDEALWGLLGWEYLQGSDGGIMAGTERSGHPSYGRYNAANEGAIYGTWEVSGEVTASGAGMFAQASRLIKPYDQARAAKLLSRAELAWDYLQNNSVTEPKSQIMYAALQLYLANATGDSSQDMNNSYHKVFRAIARWIFVERGKWPHKYKPGNSYAKSQTAHFISYLITDKTVDPELYDKMKSKIFRGAEDGGYMGKRASQYPYPVGVTKSFGWGAATSQGKYADVYCFAYRLTDDKTKKQEYFNEVSQYADYTLGLNPLGKSFVTGLGDNRINSSLHLDSWFTKYGKGNHEGHPIGNVPGMVVFGPSEGRSQAFYQKVISDRIYPSWDDLPLQRRWADGWSLVGGNEFSTWSILAWNVCMHGFLYNAGQNDLATPETTTK